MAQHGSTSTQRIGVLSRIVDGWQEIVQAQRRMALKNRPWIGDGSVEQVRD